MPAREVVARELAETFPNNWLYRIELAFFYLKEFRHGEATHLFREILEIAPENEIE